MLMHRKFVLEAVKMKPGIPTFGVKGEKWLPGPRNEYVALNATTDTLHAVGGVPVPPGCFVGYDSVGLPRDAVGVDGKLLPGFTLDHYEEDDYVRSTRRDDATWFVEVRGNQECAVMCGVVHASGSTHGLEMENFELNESGDYVAMDVTVNSRDLAEYERRLKESAVVESMWADVERTAKELNRRHFDGEGIEDVEVPEIELKLTCGEVKPHPVCKLSPRWTEAPPEECNAALKEALEDVNKWSTDLIGHKGREFREAGCMITTFMGNVNCKKEGEMNERERSELLSELIGMSRADRLKKLQEMFSGTVVDGPVGEMWHDALDELRAVRDVVGPVSDYPVSSIALIEAKRCLVLFGDEGRQCNELGNLTYSDIHLLPLVGKVTSRLVNAEKRLRQFDKLGLTDGDVRAMLAEGGTILPKEQNLGLRRRVADCKVRIENDEDYFTPDDTVWNDS